MVRVVGMGNSTKKKKKKKKLKRVHRKYSSHSLGGEYEAAGVG